MPPPVVLVTEPEYLRGEAVFASQTELACLPGPPAEDALVDAILRAGARHAIVGSVAYRGALYSTLPRGGVLARYGVGHDGIDKALATRAGVLCTNTPDVLHQSVAELTMFLVGAAARHLLALADGMRKGSWTAVQGGELHGRTLAIIGCGTIGRTVARIASAGFGMHVVGYRRSVSQPAGAAAGRHFDEITADFAAAVREADFVSLHIPAYPENVRFMDRERLSLLRQHAWLINTARGAVVDEAALHDALRDGRIGGAALDVFEHEPYEPVDPERDLRRLPNVIVVPHVGSNTVEANRRMAERAVRNVLLAEAGDTARMDLLNPEVLSVS